MKIHLRENLRVLIGLGLAVLVVCGLAGMVAILRSTQSGLVASTPTPSASPPATPSASETINSPSPASTMRPLTSPSPASSTAGWPQYSNSAFGISFSYPATWKLTYAGEDLGFSNENATSPMMLDSSGVYMSISKVDQSGALCAQYDVQPADVTSKISVSTAAGSVDVYILGGRKLAVANFQASSCYDFRLISYSDATLASNISNFEGVISSVKFV